MSTLAKNIRSLVSLTEDDVAKITAYFKLQHLKKGEYVIRSGRFCNTLGFIQSGHIRVYLAANDREITQWVSSPGYFITDLSSFISQTAGKWNMQALTDCELLTITKMEYETLRKQMPVWSELDRLFIVKCFTLMEERIFNHLYMSAEERFQHLMNTQPELFNVVPLQYLASMLGMTPETLSRLRKNLLR